MILVVTNRSDYTADWLVLELERRGARFARFNTEDYPTSAKLVWTDTGDARLVIAGRELDLAAVTAVWYRRPVSPVFPTDLSADRAVWAAAEAREALDGVWRTLRARWINEPHRNRLADSKPEQLRRARSLGWSVPPTLITNDPLKAATFVAAGQSTICKPLFSGRLTIDATDLLFFTSVVDADSADALHQLGPEPYLFQRLIPKLYDVRVTVIGQQVFGTRIESQSSDDTRVRVDWRRADAPKLRHAIEHLPSSIAGRCVELVESYGLRFAAIDLAFTDDGYVFFEINPNGQWAWIEQATQQPLRACLADLLMQHE